MHMLIIPNIMNAGVHYCEILKNDLIILKDCKAPKWPPFPSKVFF